jgi:spore maturation protein CgeB
MMTIVVSNQNSLVQREIIAAIKAVPGVRVVVLSVDTYLPQELSGKVCSTLEEQNCRVFFTLNDWGLDATGMVAEFLRKKNILHINWYVDDPFYGQIMFGFNHAAGLNRLDFVSDRGYVAALAGQGRKAFFLPLAVDPSIFFPRDTVAIDRDICFVGNSYIRDTYDSIKGHETFFEDMTPFIHGLLGRYTATPGYDMDADIRRELSARGVPAGLSLEKAIYLVKHFAGYLYRKKLVLSLSKTYKGFMVYGDEFWSMDIAPDRMCTSVKYYTNLSETYQRTKVTVDINRLVIRDGFTQRVFDCLAAGGFVITSRKKVVEEFFVTGGPSQELAVFFDEKDLRSKIDYFLAHDEKRKAVAARGRQKVLAEHTYHNRIAEIFSVLQKEIGKI